LSKSFWETAAAIPTLTKRGHQLYRRLFARRFPRALDVPAVSGGAIDRFSPGVDWDVMTARLADSLQRRPRLSAILSHCGLTAAQFWTRSAFLDQCLSSIDSDDEFLNADAVRRLREQRGSSDESVETQRELLFYWQMQRQ
jgi:hypothetical protein